MTPQNIKNVTVDFGTFNSKEDGIFQHEALLSNSVYAKYNCIIFNVGQNFLVTNQNTTLLVGTGVANARGRTMTNDSAKTLTPDRPASGTVKAYVYAVTTLSNVTGSKQQLITVNGTSTAYPSPIMTDVNNGGDVFQVPIAGFDVDLNGQITNVVQDPLGLMNTLTTHAYTVNGIKPNAAGDINTPHRVEDFGGIGFTNAEAAACTSLEEVYTLIQSKIAAKYGVTIPIIIRQTVWNLEPNYPNLVMLFQNKLVELRGWKSKTLQGLDITFDTSMYTSNRFSVDITHKLLGKPGSLDGIGGDSGAYVSAYTQLGENYHFSFADGVGINWEQMTNEKGEKMDDHPFLNDEWSLTDFGLNVKNLAVALWKRKVNNFKFISYGEGGTIYGNLQKSFIAYMNTQNANWNMSWYNSNVQLEITISLALTLDPNNGEFVVNVKHLDGTQEYNFSCEGDFVGVIKPNYTTNEKGETQDLANEKRKLNDRDIGYDDFEHSNTLLKDVLFDIFSKGQNYVGYKSPFEVVFLCSANGTNYSPNIANKLISLISTKYGTTIPTTDFLNFKFEVTTANGTTNPSYNDSNLVTIWNSNHYFTFVFDYEAFDDVVVKDINRAPHADLWVEVRRYTNDSDGWSMDCPYRDYISGITVWVSDYDSATGKYTNSDSDVRYIPRVKPISKPVNASSGEGDLVFDPNHDVVVSMQSNVNPIASTQLGQVYFSFSYGNETTPHPNGIVGRGHLTSFDDDVILAAMVIHYGDKDWSVGSPDLLQFVEVLNWEHSLLDTLEELPKVETPNIEPEIGDNMQDRGDIV